jgi:hypothetical protein
MDALLRVPSSLIVTLNTNAEWMLAGRAAARPYIAICPSPLYRHDILVLHRNHLFHLAVELVGEVLHFGFAGFGFVFG